MTIHRSNGPARTNDGRYRILLSDAPDIGWRHRFDQALSDTPAAGALALELDGPQSMTFRSSGDLRADILLIDALLGRANRSTSRRIPFLAPGCLLLVAAFAACATPRILLRHPSTGVTVECGAEGELPGSGAAYRRQRDCVEDYQRQGYERVPR